MAVAAVAEQTQFGAQIQDEAWFNSGPDLQVVPSWESEVAERLVPLVIDINQLEQAELIKRRSERIVRQIGARAVGSEVEIEGKVRQELPNDQSTSLKDAIHRAAWGDQEARLSVYTNVLNDTMERTIKSGHVTDVRLRRNQDGQLAQHGQTQDNIHANTLRYGADSAHMFNRSKVETRNNLWIQDLERQGALDDYAFVVFSRYPDAQEMSDNEAGEHGFFVDSKSCAIQVTTAAGHEIQIESAFVAGVAQPGGRRHDAEAIIAIGDRLGIDYRGQTTAQIIDQPVLIHKSLIPNGVVDIVEWYDQAVGTFFGENKPPQNYVDYLAACRQRGKQLEPTARQITDQLIAEAGQIDTPLAATKRLHQLSQQQMVNYAVYVDHSINPRVFGGEAAMAIEAARRFNTQGDQAAANKAVSTAQKTAKSSSCPSANKQFDDAEDKAIDGDSSESKESKTGKIRCIKCRAVVNKSEVVKANSWRCPACKYEVDICSGAEKHASEPPQEESTSRKTPNVASLAEKRKQKTDQLVYNRPSEESAREETANTV